MLIISLTLMQSCATTKSNKQYDSIYRTIMDDIKTTPEFGEFKDNEGVECSNFSVAKYEYHLCEFSIFFEDKSIKEAYREKCMDMDLSTLKTDKENLEDFSDKGKKCFIVHFSEKINNRIIVEIIAKKNKDKIGYESLHFLYNINNNQVKKLEGIEVVND